MATLGFLQNIANALNLIDASIPAITTFRDRISSALVEMGFAMNGAGGTFVVKRKSSDQTVNNSNVLVNDTELFFPVALNEEWVFEIFLHYSTSDIADLRATITVPAGSTGRFGGMKVLAGDNIIPDSSFGNAPNFGSAGSFVGTLGAPESIQTLNGSILAGSAGNVQFQFAQNTAEISNTIMLAGSSLIAFKV